jgi:hypothetical protein
MLVSAALGCTVARAIMLVSAALGCTVARAIMLNDLYQCLICEVPSICLSVAVAHLK